MSRCAAAALVAVCSAVLLTGGYATAIQDGSGAALHWWPTVVPFAGSGCWQVTETIADARISYVVTL